MSATRPDIEALVARFIDLRERGVAPSAESFARAHPEAGAELRAALEALEQTEGLWPEPSASLPPEVGRYRVLGEVGRGGMGRVLRVADPDNPGGELALKLLDPLQAGAERALERFRREGEILRGLSHPGIVRVLDVDVAGRSPFLVMDLVRGTSLAARIARARDAGTATAAPSDALDLPGEGPSWRRAAALVAELARAVSALHRAGVIHRDLKPANVLLTPEGRPVLVDFGLVHQESAETLTRTGDLLGTPQYMSPEQARGERLDDRADVYGLGCILYELLTLRPPHTGEDPVRVLESVRRRRVPRVRHLAPAVPRELELVVLGALAHHRRHRTSNAELLAADLDAFVAGRPVSAGPPSLGERVSLLWTFHRTRVVAAALVVLFAGLSWPILEARRERAGLHARSEFDRAVAAWIAGDSAGARARAAGILDDERIGGWAQLLLDQIDGRTATGSTDPAIAAAEAGLARVHAKEPAAALADLRRSAALAAGNVLPVLLLADAASDAGEHGLAANEYTAASRILPECAVVHERLALAHYNAGEDEAALRAARRAAELDPDSADNWHVLARIHYRRKENAEGLAAVRRCAELSGANPSRRVRRTLATLLDTNELYAEAQAVWRGLVEERPRDASNYFSLAYSYDLDHKMREAHDTYVRVIEVGERAKAQASLAWLLSGAKREACEGCRAAYAADPALYDPARAEELALASLSVVEGMDPAVPIVAAQVGARIGRRDRIRAAIEALQAGEERDERIANNERALRILREP